MQCLALQASGKTIGEIAVECNVGYQTAVKHLLAARDRLGAKNNVHAVTLAIAFEVLSLDPDGNVVVPDRFNYLAA